MKKIMYIFLLLFLVYSNKPSSNATTITKDEVVFYNLDEPLDVFPVDNGYLIKYDSYVKLKTNNSETIIDGKLKCFNFNQDSLFIITEVDKKVILSKVTNNKLVSKQLESNLNINKIIIDNNRLCLFGSCNEFSVIYEYSLDLEVIKQNNYFENCKIEFYDVKKYDDKWYIFGLKKGHSENKDICNVGNYNDLKTIIFVLDNLFNIKNIKYLNFNSENEIGTILNINDNKIFYKIETLDNVMVFQSNLIFTENYMLLKTTTLNDHIMLDINNQYLIFNFDDGLNMTSVDGTINIGNYHDVYDYSIVNGRLELIYYNKNNLCKTNIEEYHINKLDKIVVSYDNGNVDFEKDLNILEEIDVQSYFSKVEVLCNTEFLKNVFGEYNIELLIKRENHDDVKVSSKVEIKEYVNIIDGGVYCTGHSLKFLGIATLNNIKINSGHNITENGEYTLQLADNLGNIKTYNFLVVDNYYLRNQDNNLFDIIGYVNKELEIAIPLDNIEIIELYVDDKKIEFQYEEDKIIFKLQPVSDFGTKQYTINKIITKDKEYIVNKEFIVNYLKISPTIDIIENNEINPHLSFTVDDPNQTIKYIEFKMSSDNYSNSMYYCFSQDFNFNDSNFIAGTIEIIVCYDLGDGIIRKESICKLNGDYKDLNNLLSVSSIIEGERIKQIELNINMDNISKINNLIVKNQDIACKYNLSQDYTSLLVSIILTSLIVIGFVGYLIIKKCKNKKV